MCAVVNRMATTGSTSTGGVLTEVSERFSSGGSKLWSAAQSAAWTGLSSEWTISMPVSGLAATAEISTPWQSDIRANRTLSRRVRRQVDGAHPAKPFLPGLHRRWVRMGPMFFPVSATGSEVCARRRWQRTRLRQLLWRHSNHNQRSCVVDHGLLSSADK